MEQSKRNLILVGVLIGAGGLSAYAWQSDTEAAAFPPAPADPSGVREQLPHSATQPRVAGRVEEAIDVKGYTYLRLARVGADDVWAAVPTAQVEEGAMVVVANPQLMKQFKSDTLKRTFAEIYFGQLADSGTVSGELPPGHPALEGVMPPGHPGTGMPPGHPGTGMPPGLLGASTRGSPTADGTQVEVGEVAKASGPDAHTVAELHAARQRLAGREARVRGVVVKVVGNVMQRTFLHVRDGSGDATVNTHDLTVTTQGDPPQLGDTVIVKGRVAVDRDFGAGYRYALLLEDADVVTE